MLIMIMKENHNHINEVLKGLVLKKIGTVSIMNPIMVSVLYHHMYHTKQTINNFGTSI